MPMKFGFPSRLTGLTARITLACVIATVPLLLMAIWLAYRQADRAILDHELVDLVDEGRGYRYAIESKIDMLRRDVLALTGESAARRVLSEDSARIDPAEARDALKKLLEATLPDKAVDAIDPRRGDFEREPLYLRACYETEETEDNEPVAWVRQDARGAGHDVQDVTTILRPDDRRARAALWRVINNPTSTLKREQPTELYISSIQVDDETGQQTIWGIGALAKGAGGGTKTGYVAIQLNFSRLLRELDQHARLAMFIADQDGTMYLRPDVDLYKRPRDILQHQKAGEKLQEYFLSATESTGEQLSPSQRVLDFYADWQREGRSTTIGNTFQDGAAIKFPGENRHFLVAYISKTDSIDRYFERHPEKRARAIELGRKTQPGRPAAINGDEVHEPQWQAWHFNTLLWERLSAVRAKYPTLRFSLPSGASQYRYLVTGPSREAIQAAKAVLVDEFHAEPTPGFGVPRYSSGELTSYAVYLEKIPLEQEPATARVNARDRLLVFGAAASYDEIQADIAHNLEILWWLFGIAVVLCVFFARWASRRIVQPLRGLVGVVEQVGEQGPRGGSPAGLKLPAARGDEIGQLARSFQQMDGRLQAKERRLREEGARVRAIVTMAAEGIVTLDDQGTVVDLNRAAEEMFGYRASELKGQKCDLILADPERGARYLRQGAVWSGVGASTVTIARRAAERKILDGKRKTGEVFPMEVSVSEVVSEGQKLYTAIVRDITEQQQLEAERRRIADQTKRQNEILEQTVMIRTNELQRKSEVLEHRTEMLTKLHSETIAAKNRLENEKRLTDLFVAILNHDMNNYLSPIANAGQYFECELDALGKKGLQMISQSAQHLLRLGQESLHLTNIILGEIKVSPGRFSVTELLQAAQMRHQPKAANRGTRIELNLGDDLGEAFTDQTMVDRIVTNFVSNACKFTENGTITIRGAKESVESCDWLAIDVTDTGKGIPEDKQSKLFKPFPKISSKKENPEGTGLGLAICAELAKRLGGQVSCTSQAGVGSTFMLRVPMKFVETGDNGRPLSATGRESSVVSRVARQARGGTDVLVIDDDPVVCELMKDYLQKHGFTVHVAHDGKSGVEVAMKLKPCAITLDAVMPEPDGWWVLSELKSHAETKEIPVIMVTVMDDRRRGLALGVSDYFTKPVDWDGLTAVLKNLTREGERRVLVIDDEPLGREVCMDALRKRGWTVDEADDGAVGLRRVAESHPDVILLDLLMPNMDGFEFLERLRLQPEGRTIPVVVITGKNLSEVERARLNSSVHDVILKSQYSTEDLLDEILIRVKDLIEPVSEENTEVSVG
jgi:PAS domain S-box-containing protein